MQVTVIAEAAGAEFAVFADEGFVVSCSEDIEFFFPDNKIYHHWYSRVYKVVERVIVIGREQWALSFISNNLYTSYV